MAQGSGLHRAGGNPPSPGAWRLKLYRGVWAAVRTIDGKTQRVSLRTRDRAAAEAVFGRFLNDCRLAAEHHDARSRGRLSDLMQGYLADKQGRVADHARLGHAVQALTPHFGRLFPAELTRDHSRAFHAIREKQGRAPGTIARELSVLRASLRWANTAETRTAARLVEIPTAPPSPRRALSRAEYARLLAAARADSAPHVALFVVLALATAARASALLELTWERVDLERGKIDLSGTDTKPGQGKGRALVPLTREAAAALQEAYFGATTPFVFEWGGKPIARIGQAFRRCAARAGLAGPGLDDVTPHCLRHTAAVWMAEASVPMTEIAQYLGHSSPAVTYRTYARYSPEHLRGAARALEITPLEWRD